MSTKSFLSWSGGKDCCLSLYRAGRAGSNIRALLTSVNAVHGRISMHGVRTSLLEEQAASLGLPLHTVMLPDQPDMTVYEEAMAAACSQLKKNGFTRAVFGDIFLEDLKKYREDQMAKIQLQCEFPLWNTPSEDLLREFLSLGFRAIVVCVNGDMLDESFCGRLIDESFVDDLPPGIDKCGENGEYHSFVFDGPLFNKPIAFKKGSIVRKEYPPVNRDKKDTTPAADGPVPFYFCDLVSP